MGFTLDDPNKRPLNLAGGGPLEARLKSAVSGDGFVGTKALVSLLHDEGNPAIQAAINASDEERDAALRALLASPGVAGAVFVALSELGADADFLASVLNEVAAGTV